MSFSFAVTELLEIDGGLINNKKTLTNSGRASLDEDIAANQTNLLLALALDVSAVVAFYIVSDVAMTVKTNSSSSPDNTLTLVAGIPYVWYTGKYDTFKLTTDVTKLYVTNTTAGNLKLHALYDAST